MAMILGDKWHHCEHCAFSAGHADYCPDYRKWVDRRSATAPISTECGHCHLEIEQVCGMWVHVDRAAYATVRHVAEPAPQNGLSP